MQLLTLVLRVCTMPQHRHFDCPNEWCHPTPSPFRRVKVMTSEASDTLARYNLVTNFHSTPIVPLDVGPCRSRHRLISHHPHSLARLDNQLLVVDTRRCVLHIPTSLLLYCSPGHQAAVERS